MDQKPPFATRRTVLKAAAGTTAIGLGGLSTSAVSASASSDDGFVLARDNGIEYDLEFQNGTTRSGTLSAGSRRGFSVSDPLLKSFSFESTGSGDARAYVNLYDPTYSSGELEITGDEEGDEFGIHVEGLLTTEEGNFFDHDCEDCTHLHDSFEELAGRYGSIDLSNADSSDFSGAYMDCQDDIDDTGLVFTDLEEPEYLYIGHLWQCSMEAEAGSIAFREQEPTELVQLDGAGTLLKTAYFGDTC